MSEIYPEHTPAVTAGTAGRESFFAWADRVTETRLRCGCPVTGHAGRCGAMP